MQSEGKNKRCLALLVGFFFLNAATASASSLSISGEVKAPLSLTWEAMKKAASVHLPNVALLAEKNRPDDPERLIEVSSYKGILLRDLLTQAGMKHTRKWEPGVFVRVRDTQGREVIFSFGEIFYSSLGRSILLVVEKNELELKKGLELIVSTDIRAGRRLEGVNQVIVERVNIPMEAYEDAKTKKVRPPTKVFTLKDVKTGKQTELSGDDLHTLPAIAIPAAVMVGDCEGFKGVYRFEGPLLRTIVEKIGLTVGPENYNRYVLVSSEDGFCATFSLGELFNSRLDNNIILAIKRNGEILSDRDGFARTVVGEDSTGGRSVRRIHKIEIF